MPSSGYYRKKAQQLGTTKVDPAKAVWMKYHGMNKSKSKKNK